MFYGEAFNIGHPLLDKNKAIREKLIDVFSNWYFDHNDESDKGMCFVKVKLNKAHVLINKVSYKVDFDTQTVN